MNLQISLHMGFLLHSTVIFVIQIGSTGEQNQMRGKEEREEGRVRVLI